jgi:hypothetical protein
LIALDFVKYLKKTLKSMKTIQTKEEYFNRRDERNALRNKHDKTTDYNTLRRLKGEIAEYDKVLEVYEYIHPDHATEYVPL